MVYGVGPNEKVVVSCDIEAVPSDVTFKWTLNNSVNKAEIHSFVSKGTQSNATYVPKNRFGVLLCWAQNGVGKQVEPCAFNIVPAGKNQGIAESDVEIVK